MYILLKCPEGVWISNRMYNRQIHLETHSLCGKLFLNLPRGCMDFKWSGPIHYNCLSTNCIWYNVYNSYTPRTLRACCSQSKFRILKIRQSSGRALFLYNCTPNISAQCWRERERRVGLIYASVGLIHFLNG